MKKMRKKNWCKKNKSRELGNGSGKRERSAI